MTRLRQGKKVERKKMTQRPGAAGQARRLHVDQDLSRTELFLVEGDSAGGSAKQARDREFQAIMPLRGKILNTWEVDPNEVLVLAGSARHRRRARRRSRLATNVDGLRYGKVCILADADSDGAHIATLLCALFLRHFRPLVARRPHVRRHAAAVPHRRRQEGVLRARRRRARRHPRRASKPRGSRGKVNIQRFKGLGEMNPLQLRETTMTRDTRRLVQLRLRSPRTARTRRSTCCLAKSRAGDRKEWLTEEGDKAEILECLARRQLLSGLKPVCFPICAHEGRQPWLWS